MLKRGRIIMTLRNVMPWNATRRSERHWIKSQTRLMQQRRKAETMSQVSDEFYGRILTAVHAPVNDVTLYLCHAWQACEGGTAENNPWNTTEPAPGATDYNSVGVKNYPDAATGVHATVLTLNNGRYPNIIWALQHADPRAFGEAVDSSPWGTHGVAEYLAAHPAPEPSTGTTTGGDDIMANLPTLGKGAGMHNPAGNDHVRIVQATVNLHGHNLTVDGKFGDQTDAVVREFQAAQAIASDGIVGPVTWGKLLWVS